MKHGVLLLLVWVLCLTHGWAKERVALLPVSSLGMSPVQTQVLFNQLQERLSRQFLLVPQAEVESAFEDAIQSLPGEACTEENCLARVQETLNVNRIFSLQLLQDQESALTQVSLSLIQGKQRVVKNENCVGCGLPKLLEAVEAVAENVLGNLPEEAEPPAPEPPGFRLTPEQLDLTEGAEGSFSLVVTGTLTGPLTLEFEASDAGAVTLSPPTLTLPPEQAGVPQTVRVRATDDTVRTGDRTLNLTGVLTEVTDLNYGFLALPTLTVTIREDDPPAAPQPPPAVAEQPPPAPPPDAARKPLPQLEPPLQTREEPSASSGTPRWVWHAVTLGLTGVSMLQARSAADEYNALESENQDLAQRYASSGDHDLKDQYESNQASMASLKTTYQTWDLVTYLGLGVEAYLLLSSPDAEARQGEETVDRFAWLPQPHGFRMQWQHPF